MNLVVLIQRKIQFWKGYVEYMLTVPFFAENQNFLMPYY